MLKSILTSILLLSLIVTVNIIGYVQIKPVLDMPPILFLDETCEVFNDVAYIEILRDISIEDSASLWAVTRSLKALGITKVQIYINNYGGSLLDGFALYDSVKELTTEGVSVEAYGDSIVASAALLVFAGADWRTASKNCVFMVHDPKNSEDGSVVEDKFKRQYASILAACSSLSTDEWLVKMKNETWFTVQEALEWGLVDEIR